MTTVRCPQCGTQIEDEGLEFCPNPNCGYPLAFLEEPEDEEVEMVRRPGEDVQPALNAVNAPPPPPPVTEVMPATLSAPEPVTAEEAPSAEQPRVPQASPAVLVAVLAFILIAAALVFVVNRRDGGNDPDAIREAVVRRIDPSSIDATASSELPPDESAGSDYFVENTLDGDPTTAWNDNVEGPGIGQTLTFRFADRVRLARIKLLNGYQKPPDLFARNARIERLHLVTDTKTAAVTLDDSEVWQTVRLRARTASVTLRIDSVYPGTSFSDVGLSEIVFFGSSAE